jgi:hypothetical protein
MVRVLLWVLLGPLFTLRLAQITQRAQVPRGRGRGWGGGGGGGGSGGGGGGGGSGGGSGGLRGWAEGFGRGLGAGARAVLQTVAAVALFSAVLLGVPLLRPLPGLLSRGVRWVLRLDGRGSRRGRRPAPQLAGMEGLGPAERSVIAKYGAVNDADEAAPAAPVAAAAPVATAQAGYEADADTDEDR